MYHWDETAVIDRHVAAISKWLLAVLKVVILVVDLTINVVIAAERLHGASASVVQPIHPQG